MKHVWTKQGAVQVIEEDGASLLVRQPGKKKAVRISKTQVIDAPGNIRLIKRAKFDQKCGCTAVVDLAVRTVEAYNVYGKMDKYNASGTTKGLQSSPHLRRKFLKENGFVRALGIRRVVKDVAAELYKHMHNGYQIAEVRIKKATAKPAATPVAAPAPEAAAV